jgi:hypothetical protein
VTMCWKCRDGQWGDVILRLRKNAERLTRGLVSVTDPSMKELIDELRTLLLA